MNGLQSIKVGDEAAILGLPGGEVKGKVTCLDPLQVKLSRIPAKFSYSEALPPVLDTVEFRTILASWLDYKGKDAYKAAGFRSMISQAAKRANRHGVAAVVEAMERAMGNGWSGWNHDNVFEGKQHNKVADPRGNIRNLNSYLSGLGDDDA